MDRLSICLLGTVEATADGETIPVKRPTVRTLMAALALQVGTTVSNDRLADALWVERFPRDPHHALHMYMCRLRGLHPLLGKHISTTASGYRLELHPHAVDVHRFERIARAAHRRVAADPRRAAAALEAGLALWRGDALADLHYAEFAAGTVRRLEELRLTAIEDRCDAAIRMGAPEDVLPQLHELAADNPFRDRPIALLIRAMRDAGHPNGARSAYREYCQRLQRDYGLRPSPTLQQLAASNGNRTKNARA